MANKQKKKRNKPYQGIDAAKLRPSVTKISAANRTKAGQWWFDRKKILKPVLFAAAVVILVIWLILELIRVTTQ